MGDPRVVSRLERDAFILGRRIHCFHSSSYPNNLMRGVECRVSSVECRGLEVSLSEDGQKQSDLVRRFEGWKDGQPFRRLLPSINNSSAVCTPPCIFFPCWWTTTRGGRHAVGADF